MLNSIFKIIPKQMTEKDFLEKLAQMILSAVKSEKYPKLERDIKANTNFNGRVFTPEYLFHMVSQNLIRLILNMAMVMGENDFKSMGYAAVNYIWKASDDGTGDDINKEHDTNKKRAR